MTINEIQDEIIEEFAEFTEWMDKYQMLIDLGNELDGLDADNPISFQLDGNEIDEDTRELLRQSLQNALEFARLKAKEKFTPKKYRK